jgi:hypothetical protein
MIVPGTHTYLNNPYCSGADSYNEGIDLIIFRLQGIRTFDSSFHFTLLSLDL